jgi:hypothetical protein
MHLADQLIQTLYWLALSTWFGGAMFIAVAAPIIFRTIADHDPTLPKVLSVNLDGQHSTLLAGSIVASLLRVLTWIQLGCAAALLLALLGQWILLVHVGASMLIPLLRTALYLAAAVLLIYHWQFVWPRINRYRQEYLDNADTPDIANPAKDQFDRYHRESVNVLMLQLCLLLGMILFSTTGIQVFL